MRELVLSYKERRHFGLARPLGAAVAQAVCAAIRDLDPALEALARTSLLLVCVPSLPDVVRSRGQDAVLRMSRAAAVELRRSGIPVQVVPALTVGARVHDQAGLDAVQRVSNLHGAYATTTAGARLVRDRACIVVDDVVTTGATAAEAARALRTAGALVLATALVAATERRSPPNHRLGAHDHVVAVDPVRSPRRDRLSPRPNPG